jgi:hypothetical protein
MHTSKATKPWVTMNKTEDKSTASRGGKAARSADVSASTSKAVQHQCPACGFSWPVADGAGGKPGETGARASITGHGCLPSVKVFKFVWRAIKNIKLRPKQVDNIHSDSQTQLRIAFGTPAEHGPDTSQSNGHNASTKPSSVCQREVIKVLHQSENIRANNRRPGQKRGDGGVSKRGRLQQSSAQLRTARGDPPTGRLFPDPGSYQSLHSLALDSGEFETSPSISPHAPADRIDSSAGGRTRSS